MKTRALFLLIIISFFSKSNNAQTFDCYITNDHLISPTELEFDVLVKSTSTLFSFRTVQCAFTFEPGFVPAGDSLDVSFIMTGMNNYSPGQIRRVPGPNFAFQVAQNFGVTCSNGTLIDTIPVLVARWRLTAATPYNCQSSNLNMILTGDSFPANLIPLRMSVTRWNDPTCIIGTNSTITNSGTFTNFSAGTLTNTLNNMRPVITVQPALASTCTSSGIATFTVATNGNGTTSPFTYQWLDNGSVITDVPPFSGTSTSILTVTAPNVSLDGHLYTCIISQCSPALSDTSGWGILMVGHTDDSNPCTIDLCDTVTGSVTHTMMNTDDGNACTVDGCDQITGQALHTPVIIEDNNICTYDFCDPLSGVIHTALPYVEIGNDTSVTSGFYTIDAGIGYTHYIWSTGETTQSIQVNTSGTYFVTVTDFHHCVGSDSILVLFIGINSILEKEISISPNPANGKFHISFGSLKKCKMEVIDMIGQVIYRNDLYEIDKSFVMELNLNQRAGTYVIIIVSDEGMLVKKLIVE